MKKIIAIIAALAVITCLVACGAEKAAETTPTTPSAATESDIATPAAATSSDVASPSAASFEFPLLLVNNEPFTVTVADGFDNAGVTAYTVDDDATYQFISSDDDITWKIYLLDEKFNDGARYLSQAKTPDLTGNGILDVKRGQIMYVECSENAFTASKADDERLEINYVQGITGNYNDSYSQRAHAFVIDEGDEVEITVSWSSSAFEYTRWTMECKKDGDKLTYTDCEKTNITTDESGNSTSEEVYEDGTGYFTLKDGKLLWDGAAEEDCKLCVFEA
jgi:hypothetical protein